MDHGIATINFRSPSHFQMSKATISKPSGLSRTTSSAESVWSLVCQEIGPSSRYASLLACSFCEDMRPRPGLLLKCQENDCNEEIHVICARENVMLARDASDQTAALLVSCERHTKSVLYCVCKKPYDASSGDMINW